MFVWKMANGCLETRRTDLDDEEVETPAHAHHEHGWGLQRDRSYMSWKDLELLEINSTTRIDM